MSCKTCKQKNPLGVLVVVDPNHIIAKERFTAMYGICMTCMNPIVKMFRGKINVIKSNDSYIERKKDFEELREKCIRCMNALDKKNSWGFGYWSPNNYPMFSHRLDLECKQDLLDMLKIDIVKRRENINEFIKV